MPYLVVKVLVLDEATSYLDIERKAIVTASVKVLENARITIAHRKDTTISADRIFVFHETWLSEKFRFHE